jgi:N-acetylglucosamine-6-phosphate deacetylase
MTHSVQTIAAARESSAVVARQFPGIHVEGPFLSPHDGPRGAHPLEFIRSPDWDEFQRLQEAADGLIRILTMSPEHDGSNEFIRRVADSGVIVSIGHSDATAEQIRAAADAGARMCTHLGNGCHPLIHRHDNNIWPQLADDRLAAGMIVDGHHLPPDVVKTFIRAKSTCKAILVSDMSGLAGLPPGRYPSELCELEILPSGKLVVAGQNEILAGASLPLGTCMANAMAFAGVTLPEAIAMTVYNPAKLLDTSIPKDSLAPGSEVELVLFDLIEAPKEHHRLQFVPKATLVGAELVFGKIK